LKLLNNINEHMREKLRQLTLLPL